MVIDKVQTDSTPTNSRFVSQLWYRYVYILPLTHVLRLLTKKRTRWDWSPEQQEAFQNPKLTIKQVQVLFCRPIKVTLMPGVNCKSDRIMLKYLDRVCDSDGSDTHFIGHAAQD